MITQWYTGTLTILLDLVAVTTKAQARHYHPLLCSTGPPLSLNSFRDGKSVLIIWEN